jgi:ABC-type nickel/cobalt efflux system permease component RcnA
MRRLIATITAATAFLMAFAPSALAFNDGRGFYGETNDLAITHTGFILIGGFALFVLFASMLYHRLDHRRHERLDAAKHRQHGDEWHGGW